jgi:hypothetical protein
LVSTARSESLSSDQETPSQEEENFSAVSEFSEDSNVDMLNTNSTNSFTTARDSNELSSVLQQLQLSPSNKTKRQSTGDLFEPLFDEEQSDLTSDTSSNTNVPNGAFISEVPQHIYDPAEYLYLEKKVKLFVSSPSLPLSLSTCYHLLSHVKRNRSQWKGNVITKRTHKIQTTDFHSFCSYSFFF